MNASERFHQAYTRDRSHLAGQQHAWLNAVRENALEHFATQGLPGPKVEDWKYTRLKQIEQLDFRRPVRPASTLQPNELHAPALGGPRLVFIDGWYMESLSSLGRLPHGLILGSLAQALRQHVGALMPALGKIARCQEQPFVALNTLFMEDGVFLQVPKNTTIRDPVHCVFITTAGDRPTVSYPRLLIVAEENAELTVVEHYLGIESMGIKNLEIEPGSEPQGVNNAHTFTNALTEIILGPHARMEHYTLQCESLHSSHIAGIHVEQQRASRFTSHVFSLGAELARNDIHVTLADEDAECEVNGLYLVGGRQHMDHHTQVDHVKPACRSDELYKGVIQGRGRAVFNGKVVVHPAAQRSDARQTNKNLLLSAKAEVDTKPELQIYADDVKCRHGATVGQLDGLALFYLQSRGIAKKEAETLLVHAFVSDLLTRIACPSVQAVVQSLVLAQLNWLVNGNTTHPPRPTARSAAPQKAACPP